MNMIDERIEIMANLISVQADLIKQLKDTIEIQKQHIEDLYARLGR